uniref:WGS project CAEQ00000000 data, annotated contig 2263 n=1 Tax=Trypanosoma congolense (strain IL3000) TaxID=1068625 RepID=F9WCT1_TRYCI|nr:unnamed protein product [Trypanosoma congolense IL3000]
MSRKLHPPPEFPPYPPLFFLLLFGSVSALGLTFSQMLVSGLKCFVPYFLQFTCCSLMFFPSSGEGSGGPSYSHLFYLQVYHLLAKTLGINIYIFWCVFRYLDNSLLIFVCAPLSHSHSPHCYFYVRVVSLSTYCESILYSQLVLAVDYTERWCGLASSGRRNIRVPCFFFPFSYSVTIARP